MAKIKLLKPTKKKQLTFNQLTAKKPKRSYRASRKDKAILKQTFFIETADSLIDYNQPASNIALQAAKLYAQTMYNQPEYALEFAAIAHRYADAASDVYLAKTMEVFWQSTQDYLLHSKIILPQQALGVDPRKQFGDTEYHVYSLLGKGKSTTEIAKMLGRTMFAVGSTIVRIKRKLKIKTIQQIRIHSRDIGGLK